MSSYRSGNWGFGDFILKHRRSIGILLLLITAFMAWNAAHVRAATRFESLFPSAHPNVKLYQQYERRYGGAQTLVLLMRVRRGDVFNRDTLRKIVEVQNDVNILPGVDHNQVFSLASYRVDLHRGGSGRTRLDQLHVSDAAQDAGTSWTICAAT